MGRELLPIPGDLEGATVTVVDDALSLEALWRIAHGLSRVELAASARLRVAANRAAFERAVAEGAEVYGLTTGIGAQVDQPLPREQAVQTGRALLRSHAAALGQQLAPAFVRAGLAARLAALARGHSGVRPAVLDAIAALLNHDLVPCVPAGSLGPAAELTAPAHAFLPLVGEGALRTAGGEVVPSATALRHIGMEPLELDAREALALISGTSFPAAIGAVAAIGVRHVLAAADVAAALSFDVLDAPLPALDARVHALAMLPGQRQTAAHMRAVLAGGEPQAPAGSRLQAAVSLRCAPQIHGAARAASGFLESVIAAELASVTDNPLIFEDPAAVVSAGNFDAQAVALSCDTMRAALADLAGVSERRTFRLVSPTLNGDLPPFLTRHTGATGYMIVQYTAAALVSELRLLAHPVGADSIVVSDNQEDHASNAMLASSSLVESLHRAESVVAAEVLCACQALDLSPSTRTRGRGVAAARALVRDHVPALDADRPPGEDIAQVAALIASGAFSAMLDEHLLSAARAGGA